MLRSTSLEESGLSGLSLGQHHTLIINKKNNAAAIGRYLLSMNNYS